MLAPVPTTTCWFPPEWAAQQCTLLTWPHNHAVWGPQLQAAEDSFVALAFAIASRQRLIVACHDQAHRAHVQTLLDGLDSVTLTIAPSNDIWVRDHGPISVIREGRPALLDFGFNGWGGKYPADLDNQVTARLIQAGLLPDAMHETIDAILEGGSIETDGRGTLLTTSKCLLNPNRNHRVDRDWVAQHARAWFGCHRILWLERGYLEGDDTDSHIDMLARFAPDDTILHTACDDPNDVHYSELAAMADELAAFRTESGQPYTLKPLPWPPETRDAEGNRLPLSYANFLIINGAVLVPAYGVETDQAALARVADAFPGREVIAIPALALIHQHGSLHCASMQVPFAGTA